MDKVYVVFVEYDEWYYVDGEEIAVTTKRTVFATMDEPTARRYCARNRDCTYEAVPLE